MKTRSIILIVISAIATLSFTMVSVNNIQKEVAKEVQAQVNISEPVGGFATEDRP